MCCLRWKTTPKNQFLFCYFWAGVPGPLCACNQKSNYNKKNSNNNRNSNNNKEQQSQREQQQQKETRTSSLIHEQKHNNNDNNESNNNKNKNNKNKKKRPKTKRTKNNCGHRVSLEQGTRNRRGPAAWDKKICFQCAPLPSSEAPIVVMFLRRGQGNGVTGSSQPQSKQIMNPEVKQQEDRHVCVYIYTHINIHVAGLLWCPILPLLKVTQVSNLSPSYVTCFVKVFFYLQGEEILFFNVKVVKLLWWPNSKVVSCPWTAE